MSAKSILITGAGSGFGREASMRLASRGHAVVATVHTAAQAKDVEQEARCRGITLLVQILDITSEEHRSRIFSTPIDVLLCNAAVGSAGPIAEVPLSTVRDVFEVNVFGHLALAQGFARQMASRGSGRILFVSSIAGLATTAFFGPYCASKYALESIAEAMHQELKPFGITIATINPGPYSTGFNEQMFSSWRDWHDEMKNFTKKKDLGILGQFEVGQPLPTDSQSDPEEVVQLYVNMAEADSGLFRNVIPKGVEITIRKAQEYAWVKKQ